MISYAQNFEDVMLWRALHHVDRGFYIDIGAQDPVVDSVSLAFHEQGWTGIHVEPTEHYAKLLREARSGDVVLQAAVGRTKGIRPLYEIRNSGISTLNRAIAQKHVERGFTVEERSTEVIPLSKVFELAGDRDIHWMKIDVEGFEREVLASWGASAARPWIVVVESTLPMSQTPSHAAWERLLKHRGYRYVYFDGLNRFYVAAHVARLARSFGAPPNVFDDFALNGTASSPFHRVLDERLTAQASKSDHAIAELRAQLAREREASSEQQRRLDTLVEASARQLAETRDHLLGQVGALEADRDAAQRHAESLMRSLGEAKVTATARERVLVDELRAAGSRAHGAIETLATRVREHASELAGLQREHHAWRTEASTEHQRKEEALQAALATQAADLRWQLADRAARERELARRIEALTESAASERAALEAEHGRQIAELEKATTERELRLDRLLADALARVAESDDRVRALRQAWADESDAHRQALAERIDWVERLQARLIAAEEQLRSREAEFRSARQTLLDEAERAEERHAKELDAARARHDAAVELSRARLESAAAQQVHVVSRLDEQLIEMKAALRDQTLQRVRSEDQLRERIAAIEQGHAEEKLELVRRLGQLEAKLENERTEHKRRFDALAATHSAQLDAVACDGAAREAETRRRHEAELAALVSRSEHQHAARVREIRDSEQRRQAAQLAVLLGAIEQFRNGAAPTGLVPPSPAGPAGEHLPGAVSDDDRAAVAGRASEALFARLAVELDAFGRELLLRIEAADRERVSATAEKDTLLGELASITSSLSWKLTRPLRLLASASGNRTEVAGRIDRPHRQSDESAIPTAPAVHRTLGAVPSSEDHSRTTDGAASSPPTSLRIRTEHDPMQSIRPATHVDELLSLNDEPFVACLYVTLLRRMPDAAGHAEYLKQIRRGAPKESLIVAMARSDEARRASIALPGLQELMSRQRAAAPGILARAIARPLRHVTSVAEQRTRAVENQVYRSNQSIQSLERRTEALVADLARSIDARLNSVVDRIAALEQRVEKSAESTRVDTERLFQRFDALVAMAGARRDAASCTVDPAAGAVRGDMPKAAQQVLQRIMGASGADSTGAR